MTDRSTLSHVERERASVFHSWSAQGSINPLMVKEANGVYVTDEDGNSYIDFSSQLVNINIGHQHPKIVDAIKEQADLLCTIAPQHGNIARIEAAEKILDHSFDGAAKVFFTNGGTEAVEHAVRMARLHTGRPKVMAQYRSYHGATATSINLTGDPRRWPNDSASAGVVHFFGPFLYRSMFHASTEAEECERALANLETTIQFEGPSTIAAIILEPVVGNAGCIAPAPGYLAALRAVTAREGALLIADEVMTGFRVSLGGALQLYGLDADLVTLGKIVGGGLPVGVFGGKRAFMDMLAPLGPVYQAGTLSGNPLAMAAGIATVGYLQAHAAEIYPQLEATSKAVA